MRIELTDFTTKEVVDELEVDACLVATGRAPYTNGLNLGALGVQTDRRGFVPVNDKMEVRRPDCAVLGATLCAHVVPTGGERALRLHTGQPPRHSPRCRSPRPPPPPLAQVLDSAGKVVPHLYCIGDANGKYMLAHAASAQGIAAVECMCGRERKVNHQAVPAACFTHPEVSFVGLTEDAAREKAVKEGWAAKLGVAKTYYKVRLPPQRRGVVVGEGRGSERRAGHALLGCAPPLHPSVRASAPLPPSRQANSKSLAELESDGMAKLMYRKDSGEILGVHMIGLHSADNIHEFSNAMNMGLTLRDLKFNVHAHPTVAEVNEELIRHAVLDNTATTKAPAAAKQPVAA